MNRTWKKIFYTLTLSIYPIGAALAEDNTSHFLDQWRIENKVTSAVVSIKDLKTGQVTRYTSGVTEKNKKAKPSENTLYGVGSISKIFVSEALLKLQEQGKISLDTTIGVYFPQYPRWNSVTIRQLLNMSSGIHEYMETPQYPEISKSRKSIPQRELIDIAYKKNDYFEPGKGWHYSNTNYLLAGSIVEKVTGKPLLNVYSNFFFKPLDLKNTYYSEHFYPESIRKNMAHAYINKTDITNFNAGLFDSAGSMLMSNQDLLKWAENIFVNCKTLNQESIRQMKSTVTVPDLPPWPKGSQYGLGLFSLKLPQKGLIWWYTGVIDGYTSVFVFIPQENKIIVAQAASWPKGHEWILFPSKPLVMYLGIMVKIFMVESCLLANN